LLLLLLFFTRLHGNCRALLPSSSPLFSFLFSGFFSPSLCFSCVSSHRR